MLNYDVYIFTEGGSESGLGHLTRCIALYDEIESRGKKPVFIIKGEESVKRILESRKAFFENWYENWPKCVERKDGSKPDCIIDSYHADEKIYQGIQESCNKALYIDDTNRIVYPRGIIVNPSIYGRHLSYIKKDGQLYLTGMDYVILRDAFQSGYHRNVSEELKNILIILGGSDICNLTPAIIAVLNSTEYADFNKHVVIGEGFKNVDQIRKICKSAKNINIFFNLNSNQLYDLMKHCDFAITAAGQTVYELIAMQLPFSCIKVIDNQSNNISGMISCGIIKNYLNYSLEQNPEGLISFVKDSIEKIRNKTVRANVIEKMKGIDMGNGVKRIVDVLIQK